MDLLANYNEEDSLPVEGSSPSASSAESAKNSQTVDASRNVSSANEGTFAPVTKKCKSKYRKYTYEDMMAAMKKVHECGTGIRATAKEFGIPEASLRHRLSGRVNPEARKSGPAPLMSLEEESVLADHLKFTSSVGYGYSRLEVIGAAFEYAIALGKRERDQSLSFSWYTDFVRRWPGLKFLKQRGVARQRALATSAKSLASYYSVLKRIMEKYDFFTKPERVYHVDERSLLCTPSELPRFVASREETQIDQAPEDTSSSPVTTVLGCGNALGNHIPPYFVFSGTKMSADWLEGRAVGGDGEVTGSGWSTNTVYKNYVQKHLIKYLPARSATSPVLLLYDGHRPLVSGTLLQWTKKENVILFVLPAHASYVLLPVHTGCFGPYEQTFSTEVEKFTRENSDMPLTKNNVCAVMSKAYTKAFSIENLQEAFRKFGIFPFDPTVVKTSSVSCDDVADDDSSTDDDISEAVVSTDGSGESLPHKPLLIKFGAKATRNEKRKLWDSVT